MQEVLNLPALYPIGPSAWQWLTMHYVDTPYSLFGGISKRHLAVTESPFHRVITACKCHTMETVPAETPKREMASPPWQAPPFKSCGIFEMDYFLPCVIFQAQNRHAARLRPIVCTTHRNNPFQKQRATSKSTEWWETSISKACSSFSWLK